MATPQSTLDPRGQIATVLRVLEGQHYKRESPIFKQTLEWLTYISQVLKDTGLFEKLIKVTCEAFGTTRQELYALISGVVLSPNGATTLVKGSDETLRKILPRGGWFEWYDDFTLRTESPLSYHIFSSLCLLGSTLGRRVFVKMGFFEIFPNYCAVLIGPTGRVKKTSAANIAKAFINSLSICPVMADAITPEALATALARDGGHQFVYAPEFAVLFNRQKYNETLTTRIIRLLDCPRTFEVETVARGKEEIHDIALSFLGCSTPSLFTGATPDMVTSSGFLNRFLLVVEEDTEREYCIPERGERRLEIKLEETLRYTKKLEGEVVLSPQAMEHYRTWYHQRRLYVRNITDELQAEAVERGADHLLRTAMLTHIAQHRDSTICEECFNVATQLLTFVERNVPTIVGQLRRTQRDMEGERILITLQRAGGLLSHSELLRKSRLDAQSFKRAMSTLIERREVEEKKPGGMHLYVLQGGQQDA